MALFQHVCRERQVFEQGHRGRLHEEIQQLVRQRRWQEAAQAARQFIATFPTGPDTEALRVQLETLEANAEIQTRQQLESQIKEHIRRQEYWDALALARRIIADYPFSPQANALRNQLPRLEELARGHRG
jgi:outer membrane protein assembly factor BamD (BamD/ComL family)